MSTTWRSRPPWPPPLLIDLAAGREPTEADLSPELLRIAFDHRMGGLLWTWAQNRDLDEHLKAQLAVRDLRVQAHQARVWRLLEDCVGRLRDAGIEVASIKGPPTQARWYRRAGERPSSDVDLWLAPQQLERAGEAVAVLQPDHPWRDFVADLAVTGGVQNVTLRVDRIEVDLHFDLLKTGLPMRAANEVWESASRFTLPGDTDVRVLDGTAALLHFVVHLTKDRFQRLIGYADVARVIDDGVDWVRFVRLAETEGMASTVECSLHAVLGDLGLPWPRDVPAPPLKDALAWRSVWGRRIRLRGSEGRRRFKRRQLMLIPMASRPLGERRDALTAHLLPPASVLAASRPEARARAALSRALHR